MQNMRICYINGWDIYNKTASSSHFSFPPPNTSHRWKTKPWRSNYGVSSGWGRFEIDATNNLLYFDEGAGTLTATITAGTYNSDTLATEIETQMEASGTHSYTVLYNDTTNVFEIYDDTGTVILELATTTTAIWLIIGFTAGIDTSALATHIADSIRIHTSESITVDAGSGNLIDFMGVWIYHHNLSSTGTISFEASDDNFATIPISVSLIPGEDMFVYIFDALNQHRYIRYVITDIDNSDGYVELGRCWVSDWFSPEKPYNNKRPNSNRDPSLNNYSEGGQGSSIVREGYTTNEYSFDYVTFADQAIFKTIFKLVGTHKEIVILEKKANNTTTYFQSPELYSHYCTIKKDLNWKKLSGLLQSLKISIQDER